MPYLSAFIGPVYCPASQTRHVASVASAAPWGVLMSRHILPAQQLLSATLARDSLRNRYNSVVLCLSQRLNSAQLLHIVTITTGLPPMLGTYKMCPKLMLRGNALLQMYFKNSRSTAAHSFSMTCKAYGQVLHKDCSVPCEQVNPLEHNGITAKLDAELDSYDLCDVCGIDGNDIPMTRCGCCQQNSQETVACIACIPKDHAEWIQGDEDQRHWRCRRCR